MAADYDSELTWIEPRLTYLMARFRQIHSPDDSLSKLMVNLEDDVVRFLNKRLWLEAVGLYKDATGASWPASKQAVDAIADQHGIRRPG